MIEITNVKKFDFTSIPIDPFWNTSNNRESKMHKIHAYPAKFPAFITTKAIEYARLQSMNVESISDMFCGCGTTSYESKKNGINFWGYDINPVATMIAKTKSHKYQGWRLRSYLHQILDEFTSSKIENYYNEANDRLKYWFYQREYNDLFILKSVIDNLIDSNSAYYLFFICAFSNILKPTSKWLTKSIKPQVDPSKIPANVIEAFISQCKFMIKANEQSELHNSTKTEIETRNILDDKFTHPVVDLIITSPPYVTSYEYADLHQLSSIWLNYADDYRDLRTGSIGSMYHQYNFSREWKRLNSTGSKIVGQLYDQHNSKAKSVAKYYLDMQNVAKKAFDMLKPQGIVFFVIGDTEYKGIKIENARHLSESLFESGFSNIYVTKRKISGKILTPYRDKKGKFTSNSNGRKVYNEEFIIVGKKSI